MPYFRETTVLPETEYELRLVERRRLDRREAAQRWLVPIWAVWLFSQLATAAVLSVLIDLPGDEPFTAELSLLARLVAGGFGMLTTACGLAGAIVAFWHRPVLPAAWFVAGVTPWLIVVVETAGAFLYLASR